MVVVPLQSHHDRRCRGFRGCRVAIVSAVVVASGHRWPLEVVARHTKGRHFSLEKRRNSLGRVGRGWQSPRVWE
jgi:hypothetical protein